ncbi:hypothetical protein J6590_087151 [Homalodisca vitripennis]|nr:hypothetical protein J6590_087151 [Homalodisca vitripennis]
MSCRYIDVVKYPQRYTVIITSVCAATQPTRSSYSRTLRWYKASLPLLSPSPPSGSREEEEAPPLVMMQYCKTDHTLETNSTLERYV